MQILQRKNEHANSQNASSAVADSTVLSKTDCPVQNKANSINVFSQNSNQQKTIVQKKVGQDLPVQNMFTNNEQRSSLHSFQPTQKKENNTGIPDNLKSGLENISGFDLNDVRVHYNSPKPAQLQAFAYAQGNDIHISPGQEKHLPHEGWHVVQQKQGRVRPTVQMKGEVSVNDDPELEREADVMGAKAVQMARAKTWPLTIPFHPSESTTQFKKTEVVPVITDKQIAAAIAWASKTDLGEDAIRELQDALGETITGIYDESTVRAVFNYQVELQKHGKIRHPGQANPEFFRGLGLISTKEITNADVEDADFEQIKTDFPNGITVGICPVFKKSIHGGSEFISQAKIFAKNQNAVGLSSDGEIELGVPVFIHELGDVITSIQSIHRGLLEKYHSLKPVKPDTEPPYLKIKNLAIYSHGESWGMGLNDSNNFREGGLHSTGTDKNPENITAFVKGISSAVADDLRVELYACNTGHDLSRTNTQEWTGHAEGDVAGADSFAGTLAKALGPDSTVSGHLTAGHTTENFAARVFGAEAGGEDGIHIFDLMYDKKFIQGELIRLYPDKSESERTSLYDELREQMWEHYKDSVSLEHQRSQSKKRYSQPMGQEMFVDPENAKALFNSDWKEWRPFYLIYIEDFYSKELDRLYHKKLEDLKKIAKDKSKTEKERDAAKSSIEKIKLGLKDDMWEHYQDSTTEEMKKNPENSKKKLQDDFTKKHPSPKDKRKKIIII